MVVSFLSLKEWSGLLSQSKSSTRYVLLLYLTLQSTTFNFFINNITKNQDPVLVP